LSLLAKRGVFVAAASGNTGVSEPFGVQYPAADKNVFAVGAVDKSDVITEWTERGPNMDLLAPGDDVPTLGLGPEGIELFSGTSFACPAVVGAVALLREANPNLRVQDIYSILHASSPENLDGDTEAGSVTNLTFQRLDLRNSVALAVARQPRADGSTGEIAVAAYANDLAYDADGVLHIAYYDGFERTLKYVTRATDGTLSAPQTIDSSGNDVGGEASIAIDSRGRAGVAYFDGSAGDLRFAHFNGQTWDVEIVDARGSVGLYPSIAYDADDHAVISYFRKSSGDLRVARQTADGTWNIQAVDLTDVVGRSTDVKFNKATGEIAVAYEDCTRGWLKIARYLGGAWTTSVVDAYTLGVTHTSLAFDALNQPAISYYDIHRADLKYTQFVGGQWEIHRLASRGAQGLYTQLYFSSDGLANIVYHNRKNNVVVQLTGTGDEWAAVELESGGGRYIALARSPLDGTASYTWFQPGVAKLRVADV
jgi:subtilisin family serine protease